jgi:hypothetical protein
VEGDWFCLGERVENWSWEGGIQELACLGFSLGAGAGSRARNPVLEVREAEDSYFRRNHYGEGRGTSVELDRSRFPERSEGWNCASGSRGVTPEMPERSQRGTGERDQRRRGFSTE